MSEPAYKAWYKTARWQKLRALQLQHQPLCAMCRPKRLTIAEVADHIEPHRGDPTKFWDPDNLQSLCTEHHNSDKQRLERGLPSRQEIGVDGWPI